MVVIFYLKVQFLTYFLWTILPTIMDKIFDTNSIFNVKYGFTEEVISIFQELFASIEKILILAGRRNTRF